jgi:hypothetical protein
MNKDLPMICLTWFARALGALFVLTLLWCMSDGSIGFWFWFLVFLAIATLGFLLMQRYTAAGSLLAVLGVAWAYLWAYHWQDLLGQGTQLPQFRVLVGIFATVVGPFVYLHGVKRDIYRRMDEQKEEILKAIEKATTTSRPKEE